MLEIITPEVRNKLGEIGFEEDEISAIQMIHELKKRKYQIDIRKLIHKAAYKNLSEGVAETFKKKNWNEEDFFQAVEKIRDEKKK